MTLLLIQRRIRQRRVLKQLFGRIHHGDYKTQELIEQIFPLAIQIEQSKVQLQVAIEQTK